MKTDVLSTRGLQKKMKKRDLLIYTDPNPQSQVQEEE